MIQKDISILYRCANIFYQSHETDGQKFTGADPAIMFYISKNSPVNQDKIVKFLKADRATVTKALDRLEQAGYVQRECDTEDRRAKVIVITERGRSAAATFKKIMEVWREIILEGFDESEVEEFERLCTKACKNAWNALHKQCDQEKEED